MATLDNKSIKATLSAVFRYNDNPDKNLPPDGLSAAAAYISGDHSVERLYSRGHNGCSSNPAVALQQFRACEALYRQKKGGAKEAGMGRYEMEPEKYSKKFKVPMDQIELNENGKVWVEKQSTVAEHLFMSFHQSEDVPYKIQCEIADKLCASDVLRDFYCMSNRHYNTDNDHSHIIASNFSKDGSKKLSLNNAKRNELRKELDRICALDYGLSVIDDPALRWNDPDREEFIRKLVTEGKVNVYAPADYQKQLKPEREYDSWMLAQIRAGKVLVAEGVSFNREWDEEQQKYHGVSQAEAYKKWIASQENFIRQKNKKAAKYNEVILVHKDDERAARIYFWDTKYKNSKQPNYYYAVRRYDQHGYHKPLLVLLLELILLVSRYEGQVYFEKYPQSALKAQRDWRMQNLYDSFRYQQEQGVRTPAELEGRIQSVGTDLSEARKGLAYYKKTIEKGDDLYKAILTFNTMERRKEENGSLSEEEQMIWKEAYRIMSAHQCTQPLQIGDFFRRRQFAEKKVKDLDEQIKKLKKDYHDLKFIESHSADTRAEIEKYVHHNNAGNHSIDDLIRRSSSVQQPSQRRFQEKEKTF